MIDMNEQEKQEKIANLFTELEKQAKRTNTFKEYLDAVETRAKLMLDNCQVIDPKFKYETLPEYTEAFKVVMAFQNEEVMRKQYGQYEGMKLLMAELEKEISETADLEVSDDE